MSRFFFSVCEILEPAYNDYLRNDIDPFEERHPLKVNVGSLYGHLLKVIFRDFEDFFHRVHYKCCLTG